MRIRPAIELPAAVRSSGRIHSELIWFFGGWRRPLKLYSNPAARGFVLGSVPFGAD